jgi:hypothetical protein
VKETARSPTQSGKVVGEEAGLGLVKIKIWDLALAVSTTRSYEVSDII